jgi:hypothetical protein
LTPISAPLLPEPRERFVVESRLAASIEHRVDDITAVMAATGSDRAALRLTISPARASARWTPSRRLRNVQFDHVLP